MSPRRANPRSEDALLEAARVEFAQRGLGRARVEDICRRAGVSKGAFYLHFRTKEDIFREILQRFLGVLEEHTKRRDEVMSKFEHESGPLSAEDVATRSPRFCENQQLECSCDVELLELFWRNRQIMAALDGASGKSYWQLVDEFRRRMFTMVAGHVLAGRASGQFPGDTDPEFVADVVVGSYEAFIRRMIGARAKPDLAQWARRFAALLYEGLQPTPGFQRATARSLAPTADDDPTVTYRRENV